MAWTPQLIMLFYEIKHGLNSSPVLTWIEPEKTTFLKIDLISEGMGWILMQPTTDKESHHASAVLKETGTCLFELSPYDA